MGKSITTNRNKAEVVFPAVVLFSIHEAEVHQLQYTGDSVSKMGKSVLITGYVLVHHLTSRPIELIVHFTIAAALGELAMPWYVRKNSFQR